MTKLKKMKKMKMMKMKKKNNCIIYKMSHFGSKNGKRFVHFGAKRIKHGHFGLKNMGKMLHMAGRQNAIRPAIVSSRAGIQK